MIDLLPTLLIGAIGPALPTGCQPVAYPNQVEVVEGELTIRLGTDRAIYAPGQEMWFDLEITNSGVDTVRVSSAISPLESFVVLPDSCSSLEQTGCWESLEYLYPEIIYYFREGRTISPGECVAWLHYWDGVIWDWTGEEWVSRLLAPGRFSVLGGLFHQAAGPRVGFFLPQGGALLKITVEGSVEVAPSTWGPLKTRYGR